MTQRLDGGSTTVHSTPTSAESFLERLQHRVYAAMGLSAEDCQEREWFGQQLVLPERLRQKAAELPPAEFDRYRTALLAGLARDEAAPRPTPYERPHQYSILRELKEAVERGVARLSFELPVRLLIGTLPTRSLEPLMLPVPQTGDIVVVVDGNLLTYANLLAKAVAQALPFGAGDGGDLRIVAGAGRERLIDPTGEGKRRFVECMRATLEGNPSAAPAYLPDARYEPLAADLCDFMELFVLSREYSRVIEGDHRRAGLQRRLVCGQPLEVLAWGGDQELKADCMGLALLLASADDEGASLAWAWWAADVLLASYGMLERAIWLRGSTAGQALPTPMPTTQEYRRRVLRDLLRNWEGGQQAVRFADGLQPVLDCLEAAMEFETEPLNEPELAVQ